MPIKTKHLNFYMKMAHEVAKLSYCKRAQVGSVIVKDDNILAIGYNGTVSGSDNCCEDESFVTKPTVVHSEINAIAKIARSHDSCSGATLFVTLAPCVDCAKLIVASGIKVVYYTNQYRDTTGLEFLRSSGVICTQLKVNKDETQS